MFILINFARKYFQIFKQASESTWNLFDFMMCLQEYSGLRAQDLQEAKDQLLVETADMLSVPLFTAEALLRNHGQLLEKLYVWNIKITQ